MKKLLQQLIVTLTAVVITGCVQPPRYNTALDDIHQTLQKDKATNSSLARHLPQTAKAPPSAITDALMPTSFASLSATKSVMEPRFNVAAKDTPAKSFFMGLVQGTPYNMVVSPDLKGTISLTLKNVTVAEAMDAARNIYGYEYRRTSYGFEVLPQTLQTRMFRVNYLDIRRMGHSITNVNSSQISEKINTVTTGGNSNTNANQGQNTTNTIATSGSQIDTKSDMNIWKTLEKTLKTMLGDKEGRSVVINPEAGLVIVRAYPQELRGIARYLDSLQNNMERQVIIEAKILEVNLNNQFQSGIDWNILGLQQTGNNVAVLPDNFPGGIVSLRAQRDNAFSVLINLLEQQGNVQVLSSPRVSAINNEKAVIKVGQDNFFVTGVTSNVTPTNGTSTTSSSVSLTPFFAGITLDVTPEISSAGDIILQIHPSVSTVTQQNQVIDLGQSGKLQLPLAESTIRETDSVVRAHSGQIVVLGGLMQNKTAEKISATPGLSRIPFFGTLFRDTSQLSNRSELVILLRPVVAQNSTWATSLDESDADFQNLKRGFHIGASPENFGTMGERFSQ